MTTLTAPADGGAARFRLFASDAEARRIRRILDLLVLGGALAALTVLAWWAQPLRGFERLIAEGASSSPAWLRSLWVILYDLAVAVSVGLAVAALVRRRWAIVLQALVAALAAGVMVELTVRAASGGDPPLADVIGLGRTLTWPAAALTIAAAVYLGIAADLTAPARTAGSRLLLVGALASVLAGRTTPTGVIAALLVGVAAASLARLAVGTRAGHLSTTAVRRLLDAAGVPPGELRGVRRRGDGLVLAELPLPGGDELVAKVRGRDAAESRRVQRLWRALAYRDGGGALSQARDPGFEREALATLLAESRGVPVWPVFTTGKPDGANELIVVRRTGTPARALAAPPDAAGCASAWEALARLHAAGIAHLGLSPASLAFADGRAQLTELADASITQSGPPVATDQAQLLATLAVLAGTEQALASARAALDADRLAALLPYLQPPAFPVDLRRAVRESGLDVDALRAGAAAAAGVDEPELARLRRVTWGTVIRTGLLALAAAAILPALTDVDYRQLWDSLSEADWLAVAAGFVAAQLPRLAQALSTLGSVPARLPFGPVYVMQLATGFLNVALPSSAARMALNVRFFQRQGVEPATALTSGLIDSFVGNVIQVLLLGTLLLFTTLSLELQADVSTPDADTYPLLAALAALVVLTVVVAVAVPRLRRAIATRVRGWLPGVRAASYVFRDPTKLAQLVGGNLLAEVLFASALAIVAHAFGAELGLAEALLVNLSASLLTTVVPIPGGVGVAEGALIVGLTSMGLDEETAFATAITYRFATFYLPPIWGWLALRWLTQRRYV